MVIDVTHGLRHLPLLAFTSALYLEAVRGAKVEGIYYGALDMKKGGVAPVLPLNGLLRVAAWTAAVERFQESGDYGVFAGLLEEDGLAPEEAACLRRAAYLERTVQLEPARREVCRFLGVVKGGLPGAARLFGPHLKKKLSWVGDSRLGEYQSRLARESLSRGDYLRAAIFGFEAFVTGLMRPGEDETDPKGREEAGKEYLMAHRGAPGMARDFRRLRALRNALAHARARRDLPCDEGELRGELDRLLKRLLGRRRGLVGAGRQV